MAVDSRASAAETSARFSREVSRPVRDLAQLGLWPRSPLNSHEGRSADGRSRGPAPHTVRGASRTNTWALHLFSYSAAALPTHTKECSHAARRHPCSLRSRHLGRRVPAAGDSRTHSPPRGDLLHGGLPPPELFDAKGPRAAYDHVLREAPERALQYFTAEGGSALRAAVAARLERRGLPTRPDELLITSGSQQALTLLATALLEPGGTVLVEEPGWPASMSSASRVPGSCRYQATRRAWIPPPGRNRPPGSGRAALPRADLP
jgi:hypothetical protein